MPTDRRPAFFMISRRRLLAAATLSAFSRGHPATAATTGVTPIAIRWDAWYSQSGNARSAQNSLNPTAWQRRLPWFGVASSPHQVAATGTQANMDLEIQLAAQAGIKCFAFDWYTGAASHGPTSDTPMAVGYGLYQASANKSLVKWCGLISPGYLGATTSWGNNDWQTNCYQWAAFFQQSNYQKVLTNRPILFILWSAADLTAYFAGSLVNAAAAIAYLKTLTVAAGLGSPYIVVMNGSAASSASIRTSIGADCISNYLSGFIGSALPNSFANLDTQSQAFWRTLAGENADCIPICQTGWDQRPRKAHPVPWNTGSPFTSLSSYFAAGAATEIAAHIQNGVDFIGANVGTCQSKALLIYSWNECDEGGSVLCPTIGDPPTQADTGQPLLTSDLLAHVGPVLRAAALPSSP
jgi:hypothetical protein